MSNFATTKMSSRGQVVIPEEIRLALGLDAGRQFVVLADKEKDVVILKAIKPPRKSEFSELLAKAEQGAKAAGLTKADVENTIKKVRAKK